MNLVHAELTNDLLAALPVEAMDVVRSHMRLVSLSATSVLYEAGTELQHVYFPTTAVISLVSPLVDGSTAEIAVVGREGVAGVGAFLGSRHALCSAVVQHAGQAWRMAASVMATAAGETPSLMHQLLRYTQFLFTHMAQVSVCHKHHSVQAQLCSWLLFHMDRQVEKEMNITHERISGMLGVRREGITEAACQLQREGLIRYRRGVIEIADRKALEARCCECYGAVSQAYAQLQAPQTSSHSCASTSAALQAQARTHLPLPSGHRPKVSIG